MLICYRKVHLLLQLTVAIHEAVYATSRIYQLALARIEGVGSAGDFDFYHWVSLAFKLHRIVSFAGGPCKEHIAVGHILEYDGAIVFRMDTFFHFVFKLCIINIVSTLKGSLAYPLL